MGCNNGRTPKAQPCQVLEREQRPNTTSVGKKPSSESRSCSRRPSSQNATPAAEGSPLCRWKSQLGKAWLSELQQFCAHSIKILSSQSVTAAQFRSRWAFLELLLQLGLAACSSQELLTSHSIGFFSLLSSEVMVPTLSALLKFFTNPVLLSLRSPQSAPNQLLELSRFPLVTAG